MKRSARQAYTLLECLVAILLWCLLAVLSNDWIGGHIIAENQAKYLCRGEMREMSEAVRRYRVEHGGRRPRSMADLKLDPSRARSIWYHKRSYCYGLPRGKKPPIALCWDSRPHGQAHRIFRWCNAPYRNVLFADGTVQQVSEEEFGLLELTRATAAQP